MNILNMKKILGKSRGIILVSLLSFMFISLVEINLYNEAKRNILEVNSQIASRVSADINNNMDKLDYINEYICQVKNTYKEDYNEDIFLKSINRVSGDSLFKEIGIVDKEGYLNIGNSKEKIYVGDRDYFKESMNGETHVSGSIDSRIDGNKCIVYSRPLVINGSIEGVILGVESRNNIRDIIANNIYSDKGLVYVISSNGQMVIGDKYDSIENIYPGEVIQDIKDKLNNGKQTTTSIRINNKMQTFAYKKISDTDNWYVLSVIPIKEVFTGTHNIVFLSIATIVLFLVMYVLSTIYTNRKNRSKLEKIAYTDKLTGLRNSNKFVVDCNHLVSNKDDKTMYAMLVFDIKNFKGINKLFGYAQGDKILKSVAKSIEIIDFTKITARIDNDIFGMIFDVEDEGDLNKKIKSISNNLMKYECDKKDLRLNTNIGVYIIEDKNIEIKKAIDNANVARIESKKLNKKNYCIYSYKLEERIEEKSIVERELKQGLKDKEFKVLYQPKVDIMTEKIVGAEALIRWQHSKKGFISPAVFIPIAEKNGDINLIGRWVLKEVCKEIKRSCDNNENIVPISINLSRVELYQSDLVDFIKNTMDRYNVNPNLLEIEITETAALNDIEYINHKIKEIKSLGIKVSMDDFGTGFSTLNNLKLIDIDTLKIDRSMLIDIENNIKTKELIHTIINLAKTYGFDVVCEGVENRTQVEILKDLNCDIVQGFVFYRPIDISSLKTALNEKN